MAGPKPRTVAEHPRAESDVLDEALFMVRDQPAAAERFLDAVAAAYRRLAEFPAIGRLLDHPRIDMPGLRVWQVPGFPNMLILYREVDLQVHILRVIHGARSFGEQDLKDLLD